MKDYVLNYKNKKIALQILFSKRKDIQLQVCTDGCIKLRVPNHMTETQVLSFIHTNEESIKKNIEDGLKKNPKPVAPMSNGYDKVYYDGAIIPLGDKKLRIKLLKQGSTNSATYESKDISETEMELEIETMASNATLFRQCAEGFLREYARWQLTRFSNRYAAMLGVTFARIAIKEQKTRWGSCSSKKNLNYNWKLVLMPIKIQEYVVAHEIAHLKELNHSPAFWKVVEELVPDYKERVEWLEQHEVDFMKY